MDYAHKEIGCDWRNPDWGSGGLRSISGAISGGRIARAGDWWDMSGGEEIDKGSEFLPWAPERSHS